MRTHSIPVILACLWLAAPANAGIRNGPYLQAVTTDSIVVMWETDGPTSGDVHYGPTAQMGLSEASAVQGTSHEVLLSGLTASTMYHYEVTTSEGDSGQFTFTTAPLPNEPFTFVVMGDTRTNYGDHEDVIARVLATVGHPALIINTGDMVEDSDNIGEWDDFFTIEEDMLRHGALAPVPGNHDDGSNYAYFDGYFSPHTNGNDHYYSFDYGNLHVLVFDTCDDFSSGSAQYTFIDADLAAAAANPDIDHIIACGHVPPYTTGAHGVADHEEWQPVRDHLVPLFENYGVQTSFSGHDHHYERGSVNGITYIVTGGGGAPADLGDFLPEELMDVLESLGLDFGDPNYTYGDLVEMIPGWEIILGLLDMEYEGGWWKQVGYTDNHFTVIHIAGGLFEGEAWDVDGNLIDSWSYGATDPDDMDDDGDGYSENEGDCHDGDPAIHPGAAEDCDGIDNNCDGTVDEGCGDDDDVTDDDDDDVTDDDDDDDDGDPGDDDTNLEDPRDCSCSTTRPARSGAAVAGLLAALSLWRRRRTGS